MKWRCDHCGFNRNCKFYPKNDFQGFHRICIRDQFIELTLFHVSFLSWVKMNSTINWPVPNIWVFMAGLVEHCSANAEAMGSNPVEP